MNEQQLLKDHDDFICRVAYSFRNGGLELEELRQEARISFLRASRKWRSNADASLTTYAFQYIVNDLCNLCRGAKYRKNQRAVLDETDSHDKTMHDFIPAPEFPMHDVIDAHRLLARLNPKQRKLVVGVLSENTTLRALAAELGLSHQTLNNHYNAALERMRKAA